MITKLAHFAMKISCKKLEKNLSFWLRSRFAAKGMENRKKLDETDW